MECVSRAMQQQLHYTQGDLNRAVRRNPFDSIIEIIEENNIIMEVIEKCKMTKWGNLRSTSFELIVLSLIDITGNSMFIDCLFS